MYVWSRRTHWPTAPICCCIYNLWTFCLSWLFYIPVPPAPVMGPPLHSWPGISLLLPVFKELRTFGRTQCSQVGRRKPESVIISRQLLIYWSKPCLSECLQLSLLWVALNRHTRFPPRDLFTQAQSSEQRAPSRKAQSTDSQVIPGANGTTPGMLMLQAPEMDLISWKNTFSFWFLNEIQEVQVFHYSGDKTQQQSLCLRLSLRRGVYWRNEGHSPWQGGSSPTHGPPHIYVFVLKTPPFFLSLWFSDKKKNKHPHWK